MVGQRQVLKGLSVDTSECVQAQNTFAHMWAAWKRRSRGLAIDRDLADVHAVMPGFVI